MSELEMWSLVVGFILPPVLALVMRKGWSDALKASVAFAACLVVAAGNAYLNNQLDLSDWVKSALITLVLAVSTYKGFWKQIGVTQKLTDLTNPPAD